VKGGGERMEVSMIKAHYIVYANVMMMSIIFILKNPKNDKKAKGNITGSILNKSFL
jgi:hypothetical protein